MSTNFQISKPPLVPVKASALVAGLDIAALVFAFFVSHSLANNISQLLFGSPVAAVSSGAAFARTFVYFSICIGLLLDFSQKGHYSQRMSMWNQIERVAGSLALAVIATGFISFVLELDYSRFSIIADWAFAGLFLLAGRQISLHFWRKHPHWRVPTVVIGDITTVADVLYAFHADRSSGFDTHSVFLRDKDQMHFTVDALPRRYRDLNVLDGNQDMEDYIKANPDNFYVVSLESFRGHRREQMIKALDSANVRYAIIPAIARMSLYEMKPRYYFGHDVMLLHAKSSLSSPLGLMAKRVLDICISGTALLMLTPIFVTVALMLKIEGQGGSLFYDGERLGRNGKLFKCWKFRSMEPNSDHLLNAYLDANPVEKAQWETYKKLENDPRVTTRTAAFIRKASIDELPQLWSVLKGDMSIVGPRPILMNEIDSYGGQIDEYLKVKPGITGLWQVSGRNATSFQRRIYWDGWYVRNWSFWGDVLILLKTVPVVVSRGGAH